MTSIKKITACLALMFIALGAPANSVAADTSVSVFLSTQAYNSVIPNDVFIDINSMTANDIQNFLVARNSYLKEYSEGSRSAAQIIYEAAHGLYDDAVGTAKGVTIDANTGTINPRLLLVYLQKEQSLVTRTTRNDTALERAMGYACPDGAGCDPAYAGFSKQVGWGAWQLRYNYEIAQKDASWWATNYPGGTHYYTGSTHTFNDYTGSYSVNLSNAATSSIYRYTPHVFDSAYNVWQFYYGWDWPAANSTVITTNDTTEYSARTYSSSILLNGSKSADSLVYLGDTLVAGADSTSWSTTFTPDFGTVNYAIIYKNAEGTELARKNVTLIRHRTADINGDGTVDLSDLSLLANYWGQNSPAEVMTDLNGDSVVDIMDISILAANWNG